MCIAKERGKILHSIPVQKNIIYESQWKLIALRHLGVLTTAEQTFEVLEEVTALP